MLFVILSLCPLIFSKTRLRRISLICLVSGYFSILFTFPRYWDRKGKGGKGPVRGRGEHIYSFHVDPILVPLQFKDAAFRPISQGMEGRQLSGNVHSCLFLGNSRIGGGALRTLDPTLNPITGCHLINKEVPQAMKQVSYL